MANYFIQPQTNITMISPPTRTSSSKSNKPMTTPPLQSPQSSLPSSPALGIPTKVSRSLSSNSLNSRANSTNGNSSNMNHTPNVLSKSPGVLNLSPPNILVLANGTSLSNVNSPASPNNAMPNPSNSQPQISGRRSSFGLNFLTSFTNSIRSHPPNQPPSPTDHSTSFMSNSPTIANLSNFTITSSAHDEAIANGQRHLHQYRNHQQPPAVKQLERTPTSSNTSSSSDIEQPPNIVEEGSSIPEPTDNDSNDNDNTTSNELAQESAIELPVSTINVTADDKAEDNANGMDKDGFFSVRLTPLIDHSTSASGLYFSPVIRKIKPNSSISIGRYTEKNKAAAHAPQGSSAPIVFKSKVVSRTHALFQCNDDGQWFLKDCKSSSGTFLNHIRLSPASLESTMMPLLDGDIIQLGMDYRGGTEEVYRCVKMRCEFNKSWQRKVNQFNLEIHKKLKNLQINSDDSPNDKTVTDPITGSTTKVDDLSECAICLMKIEPCQALFISPCSHTWHYKCIRPIIIKSYPQFYCPNCRTMCDLETDLDEDD